MTPETWRNIAAKNSCPFYQSVSFKLVKFAYANFLLEDTGGGRGWASPNYYIRFSNRAQGGE